MWVRPWTFVLVAAHATTPPPAAVCMFSIMIVVLCWNGAPLRPQRALVRGRHAGVSEWVVCCCPSFFIHSHSLSKEKKRKKCVRKCHRVSLIVIVYVCVRGAGTHHSSLPVCAFTGNSKQRRSTGACLENISCIMPRCLPPPNKKIKYTASSAASTNHSSHETSAVMIGYNIYLRSNKDYSIHQRKHTSKIQNTAHTHRDRRGGEGWGVQAVDHQSVPTTTHCKEVVTRQWGRRLTDHTHWKVV